jgi:inorganic pyrophosphatase
MVGLSLSDEIIVPCCVVGLVFAFTQFSLIKKIKVGDTSMSGQDKLESQDSPESRVPGIYEKIMSGAKTFLREEYMICGCFCLVFAAVIFVLIMKGSTPMQGGLTAFAFLTGAATSMFCGFLGMMIATFSNARTTLSAKKEEDGYTKAFNVAFRGGGVMGYALCSIGVLVLWVLLTIYRQFFSSADESSWDKVMGCAAGYGLGGSTVAMFGRVGGGIYTKAADVGADLVGKVVAGLEEDDPNNPAAIADNVGDNVGDIAGMGADLFGSFAESTCAALVIAAARPKGHEYNSLGQTGWDALLFPVAISAAGIIVCMLCSFVATHIKPVKKEKDIEMVLKVQMVLTAILMLPAIYGLATLMLPANFSLQGVRLDEKGQPAPIVGTPLKAFVCTMMGTLGGLIIGLVTEYFTSHTYTPTQELATACKSGTAVNIIFGMALGYKSCIVPVFVLASAIFVSFYLCDLYGIALAALGMLSTLATGLTIDGFGPISDNAGGIAEMAEFPPDVRKRTDALDAAGNTTAAIGKGFAIGSAALVSLALYGAFVVQLDILQKGKGPKGVNVLEPKTFAFLLIGSMVPYWFAALTMKSVGKAAGEMVEEVKKQFSQRDSKGLGILQGSKELKPDYEACIRISTKSSLKEMIAPGALVIGSPLLAGTFFGVQAVFGLLTGSLVSSVQLAISMSNSGGAWDNCKKYIKGCFSDDPELCYVKNPKTPEEKKAAPKAKDAHDAAVQGDTVGDPFKDTSGPALNIVMKLQAIVSLVFAAYFNSINSGHGLFQI